MYGRENVGESIRLFVVRGVGMDILSIAAFGMIKESKSLSLMFLKSARKKYVGGLRNHCRKH